MSTGEKATPSWKAPGTPHKAGTVPEGEMLHPRPRRNMQRAGLRTARTFSAWFSAFLFFGFVVPSYATPFYVRYLANKDWVQKAEAKIKSFWVTRNARDHYYYMTQRTNTWWELAGFKTYNIGGEENTGDVTVYRNKQQ